MRIPQQVSERVKEAPAQALRAVFSGIGQVLLVADRIKSRAAEPDRARPVAAEPATQATTSTVKDETRWRSLDQTGNVRLLHDPGAPQAKPDISEATGTADISEAPEASEAKETTEIGEAAEATESSEATEATASGEASEATGSGEAAVTAVPSGQTEAEPAVAPATPGTSLPVPNYDSLTVPSLRARLRNLDPAQLRMLLDYEKANAGRPELLTMFERRIAKLESDGA
jgi:hypothetical protein